MVEAMYMVRTQIYLDSLQHRKLKQQASEKDISFAQLVRNIVDQHLREGAEKKFTKSDYMKIVGLGDSGRSDVSTSHDKLVGDAIEEDHRK